MTNREIPQLTECFRFYLSSKGIEKKRLRKNLQTAKKLLTDFYPDNKNADRDNDTDADYNRNPHGEPWQLARIAGPRFDLWLLRNATRTLSIEPFIDWLLLRGLTDPYLLRRTERDVERTGRGEQRDYCDRKETPRAAEKG